MMAPTAAFRNAAIEFKELLGEYAATGFGGTEKEVQAPEGFPESEYETPSTASEHVSVDVPPKDPHPEFEPWEKISLDAEIPGLNETSNLWRLSPDNGPPFPRVSVAYEITSEEMFVGGEVGVTEDWLFVGDVLVTIEADALPELKTALAPIKIKEAATRAVLMKGWLPHSLEG